MNGLRIFFAVLVCLVPCASHSWAIVNYGSDDAYYKTDPGLDSIWNSVVSVAKPGETYNGSAVYLGNNTFLTASHVNPFTGSQVKINGVTYSLDTSFNGTGVLQVADIPGVDDNPDMKLFRIVASSLDMSAASLNSGAPADLGATSVLIGFGKGKGTEVPGQGWNWGADSTREQRWGLSVTYDSGVIAYSGYSYDSLASPFYAPWGNDVASGALGDSGGALFQSINGQWVLSGLITTVTTDGSSFYNRGGQPDWTYYVRISSYATQMQSVVPEPAVMGLALLGLAALGMGAFRRFR